MRSLNKTLKSATLALTLATFTAAPVMVQAQNVTDRPSGMEMTADAILVCHRDAVQNIKQVVSKLPKELL